MIKSKTLAALLLFIFVSFISCNSNQNKRVSENSESTSSSTSTVAYLNAKEFKEKSENHLIIDIRTPFEYNMGHIEGAININYYSRGFRDEIAKLDKTKAVFIYCRSGSRTSSAAYKFIEVGFKEVYDLYGGIITWEHANFKTVK